MSKEYRLDDAELPTDMRRMVWRLARSRIQAPTPDLALAQLALAKQTLDDWRNMLGNCQREPTRKHGGGRPPKAELTDDERKSAVNYLARIKRGLSKHNAASQEGHEVETLESWVRLLKNLPT